MRKHICLLALLCLSASLSAQEEQRKLTLSGSIQSDVLIPEEDEAIGAKKYNDWALTNTYADLNLNSEYIDAGARFEFLKHPLPGYENDIKGWGVPYVFVKGHYKNIEVTAGNFYEQFGSGFILRTYEERSLGIDNSLLGGRVVYRPFKGVTVKALTGEQRRYWAHNDSWISGGDLELNLDEWSKKLQEHGTHITLGASFVNKHEKADEIFADATHKLNMPENVNAFDVRARFQHGNVNILAEYAQKSQDPSFDNGYIYRKGNVAMLSASYSKRGMSLLLQAKRSDNMSFRSDRGMVGTSSFINHLPAFTMDHTYNLAAMYPYATQPLGEWAYQAEFGYTFKRKTFLGGKYGTSIKLNYSYVHGIDKNEPAPLLDGSTTLRGTKGYGSAFWKWGGGMYYQDMNIQIEKKLTKDFKLNLMLMNQFYNMTVVEGEGGMVHSNIYVAEGKYRINNKLTLRGELQYLTTGEDDHDWAFGLLELSFLPHWMFTIADEWNCGVTNTHYYQALVTYNLGSHRIQAGYGRTSDGYNCSGGVCRYVPSQRGFTLSYNYNF